MSLIHGARTSNIPITSIDTGTDTITMTGSAPANGTQLYFINDISSTYGDIPDPFIPNNVYYVVNSSGSDFQLALQPDGSPVDITSAGGAHPSTWQLVFNSFWGYLPLEDDIDGYSFAQSGDTLILCHNSGNFRPLVIVRYGETQFALYEYFKRYYSATLGASLPVPFTFLDFRNVHTHDFLPPNITSVKLQPSNASGPGTITATASGNAQDFFKATHAGALFRLNSGGNDSIIYITGVTDGKTASYDIVSTPSRS